MGMNFKLLLPIIWICVSVIVFVSSINFTGDSAVIVKVFSCLLGLISVVHIIEIKLEIQIWEEFPKEDVDTEFSPRRKESSSKWNGSFIKRSKEEDKLYRRLVRIRGCGDKIASCIINKTRLRHRLTSREKRFLAAAVSIEVNDDILFIELNKLKGCGPKTVKNILHKN